MSTKFVECTLGVKYRDVGADGTVYGGPMYYMSKGLKERGFAGIGKVLAVLFAIFVLELLLEVEMLSNLIKLLFKYTSMLGLEGGSMGLVIGIILAILVGIVIIGGIKRIAKYTEKIVPFMAGIYVLACLVIIFANFQYIGDAFGLIFEGAFTPMAGLGGLVGVLL